MRNKRILCKKIRLQNKKTQSDIAKELGVSRGYVNMLENGKRENTEILIKYWTGKGYKL